MVKKITRMSLLTFCLLSSPIFLNSAEFNQKVEVNLAEKETSVVISDNGMAGIAQLQDEKQPTYQEADAFEQAQSYLDNSPFTSGWNDDKKVFVAIGLAEFDSENPSYDDTFLIKRSLKTMQASLDAKSQIIEYVRSEMSAIDKAVTPGTDLNQKFKDEIDKLQRKIEFQKNTLAKLMNDVDTKEADSIAGATFGDRLNSLMDAAIKKLDSNFDASNIDQKKKERFEKAKLKYQEAVVEYEQVQKKLQDTVGNIKETIQSKTESFAKMPLFGAITVAQFESWTDDRYKIGLVTVWSANSEKAARAFISGESFKSRPGNKSLKEWVNNQDWSTSTGGRKYVDDKGTTHFIGIAASAIGKSATSERKGRGIAELNAKKEVAMSIFSDVEAKKVAEQIMQTKGSLNKDESIAEESLSTNLQQNIRNRQISGLQKIFGKNLVHPISQQKMHVAIYSISGDSAKAALMLQERNYLTKILDVKNQQKMKGTTEGYKEAVRGTEDNSSEYTKARINSKSNLTVEASSKTIVKENKKILTQKKSETNSKSGSYSGAGNAKSYDW